jgi:hypothetical protein
MPDKDANSVMRVGCSVKEEWLAALDDFRNWLQLGLAARPRT